MGEGAIAIVRMSGPRAIAIADRIYVGKEKLADVSSHTLHHGKIIKPRSDQIIDEVLVAVMRAPNSYTGEHLVEINCHGGILITAKILQLTVDYGARLAAPGEFTRRAFLNGRVDLAQAEAVVDLIRSKAELSLRAAMEQLSGGLSREIGEIRQQVLNALVTVEAELDFSDQDLEINGRKEALEALMKAQKISSRLLREARMGRHLREGFAVVIVGRPNVGKSSLFNALLKSERAIVTHLPGTTRDTIGESMDLEGVPIQLVDTAGLHPCEGLIEREGLRRTQQQMARADLLLVLLDASEALRKEDQQVLEETEARERLLVINKVDLPAGIEVEELKAVCAKEEGFLASAKRGDGLEELRKAIPKKLIDGKWADKMEPMLSRIRHQEALKRSQRNIRRAYRGLAEGIDGELVAVDLRAALESLGEITGEVYNEEILEGIFSQFCVGK